MAKVFISWSGGSGRRIAELLKQTLLTFPGITSWVSSRDVQPGRPWLEEITEALRSADHAIACLTPGTLSAPWINFEAGFVFGRLNSLYVLAVGEELPHQHPLRTLQTLNGLKKEDLHALLTLLTSDEGFAQRWLDGQFPAWQTGCATVLGHRPELMSIGIALQSVQNAARKLEADVSIFANLAFRSIMKQSLEEINNQLEGVFSTYSVSADRYPAYLARLQHELTATVSAVALVGHEEHFWRGQLGKQILDTAHKDNERVFVLQTSRQCFDFMPTMLDHARKYQVYVLPFAVMTKELGQFCHDFSLIDVAGEKVVATYTDHGLYFRNIQFSLDKQWVREHQEAFARVRSLAVRVENRSYSENEIKDLWTRAERSLSELERRTIEMSAYIHSIHDYDEHEEEHAYFKEMMAKMIELIPAAEPKVKIRVLEVGAGTGILTKRLGHLPQIGEIVAVEYDWACYLRLKHNMARFGSKVKVEYQDSRIFDPVGKFDAILSSFADHHIRPGDKERYFENIARNLKPGANFIVGDEFLREYDRSSEQARISALHAWHDHIILIAEREKHEVLAQLERESLSSGIERKGDFKMPCSTYESMLSRAGFSFSKCLIGPSDPRDIGGIYVYDARASAAHN